MTKLEAAKAAIDELFGDMSMSAEQAVEALEELREEIDLKLDALRDDIAIAVE